MSLHTDEKSDEGIGPMQRTSPRAKQPNKEGSPSAEAVEERPSPEAPGALAAHAGISAGAGSDRRIAFHLFSEPSVGAMPLFRLVGTASSEV
jgi:hypothetical protein